MAQQGILSVSIKNKDVLFKSYMPFLQRGGVFVPTNKTYELGDEVFLLLTLMDVDERLPIPGKVVWITPSGSQGGRVSGIGVQFADTKEGIKAHDVIEKHLAGILNSKERTHTM